MDKALKPNHTLDSKFNASFSGELKIYVENFESIYLNESYLLKNLDWHRQDSSWKVSKIFELLTDHQIDPDSICDVGCGAGDILINLSKYFPETQMVGFDIAPQAAEFWKEYQDENAGGVSNSILVIFMPSISKNLMFC
jgi:tRNA G46 methylase TrmB